MEVSERNGPLVDPSDNLETLLTTHAARSTNATSKRLSVPWRFSTFPVKLEMTEVSILSGNLLVLNPEPVRPMHVSFDDALARRIWDQTP